MNALAHGADSLYTPFTNPVSRMTALRGAELIAGALDEDRDRRDRAGLALGAILCGYAIDSGMFAIHHVICQTLVRVCGSPHAETNAGILPRAMAFMAPRAPEAIDALAAAIGCGAGEVEARILDLGGNPPGLGKAGADRSRLDEALDAILARPELDFTPGAPTREQLAELIESRLVTACPASCSPLCDPRASRALPPLHAPARRQLAALPAGARVHDAGLPPLLPPLP